MNSNIWRQKINKLSPGIDILFDQWMTYRWNVHRSLCVFCIHILKLSVSPSINTLRIFDSDVFGVQLNGVLRIRYICKLIFHVTVRLCMGKHNADCGHSNIPQARIALSQLAAETEFSFNFQVFELLFNHTTLTHSHNFNSDNRIDYSFSVARNGNPIFRPLPKINSRSSQFFT